MKNKLVNLKEIKHIRIQPQQRINGVLPYPYFIDNKGKVGRQDFWKGEPYKLVGFNKKSLNKFEEEGIDLKDFLKNPRLCIGMYPIFEHKNKDWFTYKDKIKNIEITFNN